MAELVSVKLDDQTTVLFESSEKSAGDIEAEDAQDLAVAKLEEIAQATNQVKESFLSKVTPDEFKLEVGVGISGKAGWFFASSEVEATLKVSLTWKK